MYVDLLISTLSRVKWNIFIFKMENQSW